MDSRERLKPDELVVLLFAPLGRVARGGALPTPLHELRVVLDRSRMGGST